MAKASEITVDLHMEGAEKVISDLQTIIRLLDEVGARLKGLGNLTMHLDINDEADTAEEAGNRGGQ